MIESLKATEILKDTSILKDISSLMDSLNVQSEDERLNFSDYYKQLSDKVEGIGTLALADHIPPGTARSYLIKLSAKLEIILDKIEVVTNQIVSFQGQVKSVKSHISNIKKLFFAWYLIKAQEILKDNQIKLSGKHLDGLAETEFNDLISNKEIEIEHMEDGLDMLLDNLKSKKKLLHEKYNLGKDQANASFLPTGLDKSFPDENPLEKKYGLGKQVELEDEPEEVLYKKRATKDDMKKTVTGTVIPLKQSKRKVTLEDEDPI